jgi:hypothetical protein
MSESEVLNELNINRAKFSSFQKWRMRNGFKTGFSKTSYIDIYQ